MSRLGWMCLCLLLSTATLHADPAAKTDVAAKALAEHIDRIVGDRLAAEQIAPAPPADDAEFLRRVYVDLAGRIPSVKEARAFLADKDQEKRKKLIDRLLESPAYVNHFTNLWRAWLLPENTNNFFGNQFRPGMEAWLREHLRINTAYDAMVRELLAAGVTVQQPGEQPVVRGNNARGEQGPLSFYQANENKPENLAAATTRLFLGVKLECAQCHNHPFAKWTQEQFWGMAAFFSGLQSPAANGRADRPAVYRKYELKIPGLDKTVWATFLDGKELEQSTKDARAELARWVTDPSNPFFARATVNRLWSYMTGTGVVEPFDDMNEENQPSHPELLDELARSFVASKYDLKLLLRGIANSQTYQRASMLTHPGQGESRRFARAAIRGLSPEQLYDSVARATGNQPLPPNMGMDPGIVLGGNSPREEFLARFNNPTGKRTDAQTSILQALALMNGKLISDATSLERSETLAAVVDSPFFDNGQRLETLYLATLTRLPRAEEKERLLRYVDSGGPSGDPKKALADIFWALLNSSEFMLNH